MQAGKTKAWQEVVNCLPACLVVTTDSGSEMSDTGTGVAHDLHIKVQDEYKYISAAPGERVSSKSEKNEQTRISTGLLRTSRLEQDATTGEWNTKYYTSICRWFTISSTNNPERVVPAIASRTCFLPFRKMSKAEKAVAVTANRLIAAEDDEESTCNRDAWHFVLRTLASTQGRYTSAEACGMLPDIDMRCFTMFWSILEAMLGVDNMPARRTKVDLSSRSSPG